MRNGEDAEKCDGSWQQKRSVEPMTLTDPCHGAYERHRPTPPCGGVRTRYRLVRGYKGPCGPRVAVSVKRFPVAHATFRLSSRPRCRGEGSGYLPPKRSSGA